VRYACIVDGQEVSDVAPISRGVETFVHTGRPPSAIRVTELPKEPERASTPSRPPFLAVIATEERGDDD
jgi:hypothetical protein